MAEQQTGIAGETDLRPREFVAALVMAATWYFLGPWGLLPTLWFLTLAAQAGPAWLAAGCRLLPAQARRRLEALVDTGQELADRVTAPWREDGLATPTPTAPSHHLPGGLTTITLAELVQSDNLLVVGNRGSGKTRLLQALAAARQGACYVLDPHNHPGKWPAGARVIGGGRTFDAIVAALASITRTLSERARRLNTDRHAQFAPLTLISDEWGAICAEIGATGKEQEPPGRMLIRLLKEGRKFGISFIGCAHGDTAESLGSRGDTAAFRQSFDWIIYTGGFVRLRLERDYAEVLASIPLARNDQGGTLPLTVVAWSPTTGEQRLLDLRMIGAPTASAAVVDEEIGLLNQLLAVQPVPERRAANSPHSAAAVTGSADSWNVGEPAQGAIAEDPNLNAPPTPDELRRLVEAVRLYQEGGSKKAAIEQVFQCKKGGGLTWRRAARLFDQVLPRKQGEAEGPPTNVA